MPFKLCNCDKEMLNKVIDQVKTLTDTVEELTAQIHSMKLRSIVASDSSLPETCRKFQHRRDNIGAGTFHKLKRCLEKNIMHILPTDAGYLVKKKCQQIFSQSPSTFVPCPGRSTPRGRTTSQHLPSTFPKKRDGSQCYKSCPIARAHETRNDKSGIDKSEMSSIRKRRKCVTKDAKTNTSSPSTVASSWKNPIGCDKSSRNSSTSYELHEALHSSFTPENFGKSENRRGKNKTRGTITTVVNSAGTIDEETRVPVNSVKHQRIVDFVDKKENNVAVQAKDSSTSFAIFVDNTSICNNRRCTVIDKGTKETLGTKKAVKSGSPDSCNYKSRSAQCSLNCSYLKRQKLYRRDVSTNTFSEEFIKAPERVEEQTPTTQKTVYKSNIQLDDSCFNEQRRYCPKAKRNWFLEGSLTSLTSCSPRSISSLDLGSEVLDEGLMQRFHKSDEEDKFEKQKKFNKSGKKKETMEKATSSSRLQKTIAEKRDYEPRGNSREGYINNRRKRTYIISSDIEKPNETLRDNFQENVKDFSVANTECRFYEKKEKNSRYCEVSKKPAATSPTCLQSCPKEYKNKRLRKTVCTNRATNDDSSKLSRWQRRQAESRIDEAVPSQICRTSSFSRECLKPPCTLISDSDLPEKAHCSLKKYPRYISVKKKKIKNEIQSCVSPEKTFHKYTVCTSLSGSVMSIASKN